MTICSSCSSYLVGILVAWNTDISLVPSTILGSHSIFDGGHTAELTYLAFVTHHGLWAAKGWTQGHLPAKARIYRRIYGQTWVLCGDFNLIYLSTKKNNDQISRFPNGLEFMELHLYDRLFTSRNKQSHPTLKCIDNLT